MNRAVLAGAVLVLALLAGFYYFVDIRGRGAAEEEETASRRLVADFDHRQVRAVTIESAGGPVFRVVRASAETAWRVEAPEDAEADPDVLEQLLQTLSRLTSGEDPFPPGDDGLAPYGLEPPSLSVGVEGEGGGRLALLAVGGPAPYGASRYAAVRDTGELGLVDSAAIDAIPGSLFDLREKRLVRFTREDVQEVRLEPAEGPAVVIRRRGDKWEIIEPLAFDADRELVGNLLWDLGEIRAVDFPDAGDAAGLEGSLDCRIGLTLSDGAVIDARFGDPAGAEDRVYASAGSGVAMTVDAAILAAVRRPADQWRELRPFPRYSWEVEGLTVGGAGAGPVTWRRGEDGAWRLDGGAPDDESAAETIDRALELLTGLKACGLTGRGDAELEAAGLVEPAYTVTLAGGPEADPAGESLEIGFPRGPVPATSVACGEGKSLLCGIRPGGDSIYVIDEPGREELRSVLERLCTGPPDEDGPK